MAVERTEVERELQRVVDRLNSIPLTKVTLAAAEVQACAETLVREGRARGVPIPDGAKLPVLQPQGFGSMIAVLGSDCLGVAVSDDDLTEVLAALVALRRSLP